MEYVAISPRPVRCYVFRFLHRLVLLQLDLDGFRLPTMKDFVLNTMSYLEEYHQRSNSESGFAADKKMLGWNVAQKRDDRIDNALFCTGLWHNLFNMGRL